MLSAFFVVSLHLILFSLASGSVQTTCYSMKHTTKNRRQMVSISKLYLTLRKKLLFVSVLRKA